MDFVSLIIVWVLIFSRLSMVFVFLPIFSSKNIPMTVKISLISLFSYIFLFTGAFSYDLNLSNSIELLKAITFEMINGFTIGFAAMLVMNTIYLAGQIIDMNMGFSMVNVMSAQDEASIPVTANFYYILILVIFIITNSHYAIIEAVSLSLNKLELGTLGFNLTHVGSYISFMSSTFEIGFRLSVPIILTIIVSNLILGLLSKAMPGMNVFMIGMPFKILVGLATILIVLPSTFKMINEMIEALLKFISFVIESM